MKYGIRRSDALKTRHSEPEQFIQRQGHSPLPLLPNQFIKSQIDMANIPCELVATLSFENLIVSFNKFPNDKEFHLVPWAHLQTGHCLGHPHFRHLDSHFTKRHFSDCLD